MTQLPLRLLMPGVSADQERLVNAYIMSALPRDVPTYVTRVHGFREVPRGFVADVEVVDGGRMDITITGALGAAGYRWGNMRGPEGALAWDERRKRWRRYPDPPV